MKGRRSISLAVAMVCSAAVIAVAAVPASASVPGGQGLGIFGVFDCGDPLGEVEVFGAPAVEAANAYLIDTEGTGPHVVATRFEFKSPAGEVFFEKNFGKKAGLTTFNCTQTGLSREAWFRERQVSPPLVGEGTHPAY